MSEKHSKLYYFFLADDCRITINILVLIGFILFIIVLYKAFNNKKSIFNLLFIVIIEVIVCALLSIIGYLFNWKIKNENNIRNLIFGKALCKIQSIFLNYFQTARESLLTSLTIICFLEYKKHDVKNIKYQILIHFFCYGIPFISNLICGICDGYTENDLFCFTRVEGFGRVFGIIHYLYLTALTICNLILVSTIIIMDYKEGKNLENWLDDGNSSSSKCSQCVFIDPLLKKIIPYPFAQICALTFPIIYRVGNKAGSSVNWAKIAAIGNSSSAILYTLIFFYFNKMVLDKDNKENNIMLNETKELEQIYNE